MKRNAPLERRTGLKRGSGPARKPTKRSQPRRDWTDARAKVERAGCCRVCGYASEMLQAAHIVGREHDEPTLRCTGCRSTRIAFRLCLDCFEAGRNPTYVQGSMTLYVKPDRIWEACPRCHRRYDPHTRGLNEEPFDLLPYLTSEEKEQALRDLDWDVFAFLYRTTGRRFGPLPEQEGVR